MGPFQGPGGLDKGSPIYAPVKWDNMGASLMHKNLSVLREEHFKVKCLIEAVSVRFIPGVLQGDRSVIKKPSRFQLSASRTPLFGSAIKGDQRLNLIFLKHPVELRCIELSQTG
jgi:hypothetical protein